MNDRPSDRRMELERAVADACRHLASLVKQLHDLSAREAGEPTSSECVHFRNLTSENIAVLVCLGEMSGIIGRSAFSQFVDLKHYIPTAGRIIYYVDEMGGGVRHFGSKRKPPDIPDFLPDDIK